MRVFRPNIGIRCHLGAPETQVTEVGVILQIYAFLRL